MKAIILAGGSGSRLYPLTQVASKQLQAVFDKPMIYYPITVLIAAGVREFCLISTPHVLPRFSQLLGDGSRWGISIEYREQGRPKGIAQAFLIRADFIAGDKVVLMLGNNIFSGGDDFPRAMADFKGGATVFAYHVKDPQRYGVVEFDRNGKALSIEEKPEKQEKPEVVTLCPVFIFMTIRWWILLDRSSAPRVASWKLLTSTGSTCVAASCACIV
jgi:glucose-1-phosphate thymidylyltransferase